MRSLSFFWCGQRLRMWRSYVLTAPSINCWAFVYYAKNLFCSQRTFHNHVRLISAQEATWPFRIWRVWLGKLVMSSEESFNGSIWATLFVQISSGISNKLDSGCMTTKAWCFAWTGTRIWLSNGVTIVTEARISRDGVLLSASCPCGVPMFFCYDHCCTRKTLWRIGMVLFFANSTALSPGRAAYINLSEKSAPSIIGVA